MVPLESPLFLNQSDRMRDCSRRLPTPPDIRIHLLGSKSGNQILLFESPHPRVLQRILHPIEIQSGDSRIIAVMAITVPPLEDLKEPFWEKLTRNLSASGEKSTVCAIVISYSLASEHGSSTQYERLPFMLEMSICN